MKKNTIVVCNECGLLYNLHYVDNKNKTKFECVNCGFVRSVPVQNGLSKSKRGDDVWDDLLSN